jgi:hypothetical protein
MVTKNRELRTCPQGHHYYKSSDCPVCPICEQESKPHNGFLSLLSAPARRALEHADITSLQKLSQKTEREILALHGIGPGSMPTLMKALKAEGLSFLKDKA